MNYVLSGEESYLRNQKLQHIIEDLKCDDMNVVFYDANKQEAQEVISDCNTLPFFSEHKVVVLTGCKFLTSAGLAYDEELLLQYLKTPLESTTLVFVCETKLDARKKIVKEITKLCTSLKFTTLDQYERDKYLQDEVKRLQLHFDPEAFSLLKLRIGFDVANIVSEVKKISLCNSQISKEMIEQLIPRPIEDDVFQLTNAIFEHNMKQCFDLVADFKMLNVEVIALIALLASQFRFLSQVKSLAMAGMGKQEIASELNAHPYRVEKTLSYTRSRDLSQIKEILNELAALDQRIKLGLIEKNLGLELFILKYCR